LRVSDGCRFEKKKATLIELFRFEKSAPVFHKAFMKSGSENCNAIFTRPKQLMRILMLTLKKSIVI
jgi:hypothetical protein